MRLALVALLAGLALLATAQDRPAIAATYTFGDRTYTTDVPPSPDQLGPLPGSKENPDTTLPHDDTPAYVLVGVVALAVLMTGAAWLLLRWLALEPRWVSAGRHAFAEAGWRAAGTWDDFRDWLRLSR